MTNSIVQRVVALEARATDQGLTYILSAPSGDVLIVDQAKGETLRAFRRRTREAWQTMGHGLDLLPQECREDAD